MSVYVYICGWLAGWLAGWLCDRGWGGGGGGGGGGGCVGMLPASCHPLLMDSYITTKNPYIYHLYIPYIHRVVYLLSCLLRVSADAVESFVEMVSPLRPESICMSHKCRLYAATRLRLRM